MKINKNTASHYVWKSVCDGWHFVEGEDLSVIVEKMPPHTVEDMHYHMRARQFFYVLAGMACMVLESGEICLQAGEGIEISPMQRHQMKNNSEDAVEFIAISSPKAHGDRVTL